MNARLFVVGLIVGSQVSACEAITFRPLGDLPGGHFASQALGVSGNGKIVVGEGSTPTGPEAFRWENGVMVGLGFLPGAEDLSRANAISADGNVIVGVSQSGTLTEAFRWENGIMAGLGDLLGGGPSSSASAVSGNGSVIVGHSESNAPFQAFRWDSGGIVGIPIPAGFEWTSASGISDDGTVIVGAGSKLLNGGGEVLLVENGVMSTLNPFNTFSSGAQSISGDGNVIVGAFSAASGSGLGFKLEGGVATQLDDFGTGGSIPLAVSHDGSVIVGRVGTSGSTFRHEAAIWIGSGGVISLKSLLLLQGVQNVSGWHLNQANAVSDDGTVIVGVGLNPDGNDEAWIIDLNEVPEPSSVVLWLLALSCTNAKLFRAKARD